MTDYIPPEPVVMAVDDVLHVAPPPEADAALVAHLVSAAQVNNVHALRAAAGVLVDRLDALREAAATLNSERTRRVAAQEAITGHWAPMQARALRELDAIAHVPSYSTDPSEAFYDAINRVRRLRAALAATEPTP